MRIARIGKAVKIHSHRATLHPWHTQKSQKRSNWVIFWLWIWHYPVLLPGTPSLTLCPPLNTSLPHAVGTAEMCTTLLPIKALWLLAQNKGVWWLFLTWSSDVWDMPLNVPSPLFPKRYSCYPSLSAGSRSLCEDQHPWMLKPLM
jgi:hypothetical protein